jgi:hypothetical protein
MTGADDLENELYEIYNDGVPPTCKYFRDRLNIFKNIVMNEYQKKEKDIIICALNKVSTEIDKKIVNYLVKNNGCIIATPKTLEHEIGTSQSYICLRLILLESKEIIKTNRYERIRVLFFHENIRK